MSNLWNPCLLLAFLTAHCTLVAATVEQDSMTAGTKGVAVVKHVVWKIQNSKIFPDDMRFLYRIACVESKFGMDPLTYRADYHGGIWQVDKVAFEATQDTASNPGLQAKFDAINATFGIEWENVTWMDLRKPFYSALAARLFLKWPIPSTLNEQAEHWKKYYNTPSGAGTVKKFIDDVKAHGDPHVSQLVQGSDTMLCYDLLGGVRDVYHFLNEPFLDLQSTVKLVDTRSFKNKGLFIGELIVTRGVVTVIVRPRNVTVGDKNYNWKAMKHMKVGGDDVEVNFEKGRLTVDVLGVISITVIRPYKNYLNLAIQRIGSYSDKANGIIGDVYKNVRIVERGENHGELHLANSNGVSIDLIKKQGCWNLKRKPKHKAQAFQKLLARNLMECHTCTG